MEDLGKICGVCSKPIRTLRKGSFTSWIFKDSICDCSLYKTFIKPKIENPEEPRKKFIAPEIVNRYRIEEIQAEGGVGYIYKAVDQHLDKQCVVKVLRAIFVEDESNLQRFGQEAKICARFNHPNLVPVTDYGVNSDGLPFLVMDYLEGFPLSNFTNKKSLLPVNETISIFLQVCSALEYSHNLGIIHRDIKPDNIYISKEREKFSIKLLDFGIARYGQEGGEIQRLTQTGEVFGSPDYMSPEHCCGQEIDERSDIYSLGCVLYEMLTGKPPFRSAGFLETLQLHVAKDAKPPSAIRKDALIPKKLDQIILKCLCKDPTDRYQNVSELTTDVSSLTKSFDAISNISMGRLIFLVSAVCALVLIPLTFLLSKQAVDSPEKVVSSDFEKLKKQSAIYRVRVGKDYLHKSADEDEAIKREYIQLLSANSNETGLLDDISFVLDENLAGIETDYLKAFKSFQPKLESFSKKILKGVRVSQYARFFTPILYFETGRELFEHTRYKEAIDHLKKARTLCSSDIRLTGLESRITHFLACSYYAIGNYSETRKLYLEEIDLINKYFKTNNARKIFLPQAYFNLAVACVDLKQYGQAKSHALSAYKESTDDSFKKSTINFINEIEQFMKTEAN